MTDIALHVDQTRTEGLLGASDAACALGLDPYRSPLTLWRKLRGEHVDEERPAFVEEAAEWGQVLEPVVRGKYALKTDRLVFVPRTSATLDGWLRCTPDGISVAQLPLGARYANPPSPRASPSPSVLEVESVAELRAMDPDRFHSHGLLQCKTASAYKRDEWEAGAPTAYEIQCRVEMAVCDLPWNDLVCLVGGQKFYGPIRIVRDMEIERTILGALKTFWNLVQEGREPPVDASADWREYASSKMRPSKVVMVPDDETSELVAFYLAQRKRRKMIEQEEEAAKTDLLVRLSAAGATAIDIGGGRKITAYQSASRVAWKEYALSLGGLKTAPDQFKGQPGKWALRAPKDDGDEDE